ncbi:MAG: alpha/beta hydrolase [Erysipelotrichaceae bacterium]|nr:alpha/beta hydrolase [Erysipelotrichaceae bacterium]
MRKYDRKLVEEIRNRQYVKNVDGIDILFKPVPDDDREHAMDPRLFEIASMKKKMFSDRAKGGYRLSNERYRPDKVTYDLIEEEINCDERLIPVNGTHMIDLYIYRRADINDEVTPVLIYLHGGGFTAGDIHLFEKQMQYIAEQSKATVVFPEYRLAPETPYPGAHEDAFASVEYVYDHADELHIDRNKLMVAGDSAGGVLTNACVQMDIEKGRNMIKKIYLLYPLCDNRPIEDLVEYDWSYDYYPMLEEQKEIATSRVDRIKNAAKKGAVSLYDQGFIKAHEPLMSAYEASDEILSKFPETVVNNSEFDYLRIGGEQFAKKLKRLGVNVRLVTYCGCDHGILDMLGTVVQAEEICLCLADELKAM